VERPLGRQVDVAAHDLDGVDVLGRARQADVGAVEEEGERPRRLRGCDVQGRNGRLEADEVGVVDLTHAGNGARLGERHHQGGKGDRDEHGRLVLEDDDGRDGPGNRAGHGHRILEGDRRTRDRTGKRPGDRNGSRARDRYGNRTRNQRDGKRGQGVDPEAREADVRAVEDQAVGAVGAVETDDVLVLHGEPAGQRGPLVNDEQEIADHVGVGVRGGDAERSGGEDAGEECGDGPTAPRRTK
jgi:hypothetical protein